MKYGLVIDAIRDIREYVLGASQIPYVRFNEDGDWRPHAPKYEPQTLPSGEETHMCTLAGCQNQIETLEHFLYKQSNDYAEAFNYPRVPIMPERGGADPHTTYENVRHDGLILERDYPTPNTLDELKDKTRQSKSLEAKGQVWITKNDFKHEFLWSFHRRPDTFKDIIKDALTTCPLGISVDAWTFNGEVYVSNRDGKNNHWCVLLYIGDYLSYHDAFCVFDTYDQSIKWLHPDHDIRMAKRIWLQKKTKRDMGIIIRLLQTVLKSLSMKPTLSDVARGYLGTDASPSDRASDEFGCSESVTTIVKQLYPEMPIILGTWTLWMHLRDPKNGWVEVDGYEQDAIVISPTGTGRGTGHVGICMGDDLIASSNSIGTLKGKFTQNYTVGTWTGRYAQKQGMPVLFFKHV